jgi:hypothetical protein
MLKQGIIFLVLSILVVIFSKFAHVLIVYIDMLYTFINIKLMPIFSHTNWGQTTRKVLVLLIIPFLIVAIPALIYRFSKGKTMPYLTQSTWCVWLVLVLCTILIH